MRAIGAELAIRITAEDNASASIQAVGRNAQETTKGIKGMGTTTESAGRKMTASSKNAAVGFSGMATAGFAVYSALDRVQDMQVAVDRANYMVKASTREVENAQEDYNKAIERYGVNSPEAAKAAETLALAQEKLQIATDRAEMTQGNQNDAMAAAALTVIPAAITMVANAHKAFEGFAGLRTLFCSRVGDMSASLRANAGAWTSVMLSMAGIGLIIGAFTSSSIELRVALAALGAVLIVLAIRQWAVNSATAAGIVLSSFGLMTWVVIGAIAAAALVAAAALTYKPAARGGIFTKPTFALIGEAGPEAVIPLAAGRTVAGPTFGYIGATETSTYNYENHFHITASNPDVVMNKIVREFRRRVGAGL